ncbi:DUF4333 domain-containing protein [Nocardia speluncae]|uniref:DUF4333 domain-containing protein n=1 Tax=Nocardia speluncae TaxID=419477 RepID=A0A846XAT9_9NOCA|nr:DUF4333 domain-containing protein [Nocardia speluncae]NKY31763.1 DUF4333 domain-containing protein [Nocardia speluncae]
MRIAALISAPAAGAVLLLGACANPLLSAENYFERVELELTVEYLLRQQGEVQVFAVECPKALEIRMNAQTHCRAQNGDGELNDVTVVVIRAAGERGRIAVQVNAAHSE